MKYKAKFDIEIGTKLKIVKKKNSSYGMLDTGTIVTLKDITHFPTRFNAVDENGVSWTLFSYDFEEIFEK